MEEYFPGERNTTAVGCRDEESAADRIAPYLFPCVIEYSLIAAAAVFRIYLNMKKPDVNHNGSDVNDNKVAQSAPTISVSVDCGKATKGLFLGIFIILLTAASIVAYFILDANGKGVAASYVFLLSDITLIAVTMAMVVMVIIRTRCLAFVAEEEESFDDKLLMISQVGIYFYSTFIILSSARSDASEQSIGFLFREVVTLIQTTAQTVMIINGFRFRAETDDHVVQKPGRAAITLVLACNFALWMVNTFEIKRAEIGDIHVDYYSKLAWRLVVHLSLPLVIFYRFHSTVCLSDIWANAYTKEKEE